VDREYENPNRCIEIADRGPPSHELIFTKSFKEMLEVTKIVKIDIIISFGFQISDPVDFDNLNETYEKNWKYYIIFQELGNLFSDTNWFTYPCLGFDFIDPQMKKGNAFTDIANSIFSKLPISFVNRKLGI
jgi:hypothetical protein